MSINYDHYHYVDIFAENKHTTVHLFLHNIILIYTGFIVVSPCLIYSCSALHCQEISQMVTHLTVPR